jgi:1-deoxy-D-xylulose-5-phosphate synthase
VLLDISLLRAIPGMTLLSPSCAEEVSLMLVWALSQDSPCAIRYPKALTPLMPAHSSIQPIEAGRGVFTEFTSGDATVSGDVLVAFTGGLYPQVSRAALILRERGVKASFYNLRFLKPVDEEYLAALINRYKTAVFVEEGVKSGGFGEYVADLALHKKCAAKVITLNAGDRYFPQGSREELLADCGLDGEGIAAGVCAGL